jgi:SAM-dependent methyltransferase
MVSLKSKVSGSIQKILARQKNSRGIKFLLTLQDKLYYFTLHVIKLSEESKGGNHPKHWVTDYHRFFTDAISPSDTVLEIGSAYGSLAYAVSQKAKRVTALEIRQEAVAVARQRYVKDNLIFVHNDFFKFPDEQYFDAVILSNVLEHIEDRVGFLRKAASLGNKLLIRVPAFDRDWLVPYKQSLSLDWRLNKDHKTEYTEETLKGELSSAGLRIEDFFCKWGNYCCVARKKEGLRQK